MSLFQVRENVEHGSADLIVEKKDDGKRWQRRLFTYLATCTCVATILWYAKPHIFAAIFSVRPRPKTVMLDI